MGTLMQQSKVASAIFDMVEPAVRCVAHDLQVLTVLRPGAANRFPSVLDIYETTLVFLVFRYLLMYSELRDYDVRWEETMDNKMVDLWLRHIKGGEASIVEAGDYSATKVHSDLAKAKVLAAKGSWYFLAFFRENADERKREPSDAQLDPAKYIADSFAMGTYGLDPAKVEYHPDYCRSIKVEGPAGRTDAVGCALLKGL